MSASNYFYLYIGMVTQFVKWFWNDTGTKFTISKKKEEKKTSMNLYRLILYNNEFMYLFHTLTALFFVSDLYTDFRKTGETGKLIPENYTIFPLVYITLLSSDNTNVG